MPKQDSAQLLQLREAFTAYSRSQTKANQDIFRTNYLNYIRQITRDLSLPEKDDDITFIQGDSIHHVFSTMATELSPCYTADARNQHFPTAVLISIPYQYRKTSLEQTSPPRSNRADKNTINHTISSHTKASIAELMLFFTQTLTHRSMFIESPRSASLLPEATIPQEVNAAIKTSLAIQLGEPYESHSKNYNDLLSDIGYLKEKSHSKISYLTLLQSGTLFPIAAQFAHLLKYQEQLPLKSLNNYQDSVKNEVSRYNYEENIERALCVFSPVREQINYQEIPDSSHQITLNITS
tara:strand:- start:488 stop:1372 length:885 start_codon:yes stop_codon:yes gene_type:complete